jgi:hypothetical protein
MPSKKYIITILDGPLNGCEFIKYSQIEADDIVDGLDILGSKYKVRIIELH